MTTNSSKLKHVFRAALALLCLFSLAPAFAAGAAPDFSLPTDHGKVSLSALKGQVVYVDFWASWCSPCRKSFPWMNEIYSRYKDRGFRIVAVNLDSDREDCDKFLKKIPADFTIAFNPEGNVADAYGVMGMPSSYLIDREGRIHATHMGFRDGDKAGIESEIRALLN